MNVELSRTPHDSEHLPFTNKFDLIWYDSEAILHLMKRAKFKEGNFSFPNVLFTFIIFDS